MSYDASGGIPLAPRNRLQYTTPGLPLNYHAEISTVDRDIVLKDPSQVPPEQSRSFSAWDIFTYFSTSYSVFIMTLFKCLAEKFWHSPAHTIENSTDDLRDDEALDFALGSGFPGESTPINTSLVENNNLAGPGAESSNPPDARSTISSDLYHSIFELDSSDGDDVDLRDQYGTSLKISEKSTYKPNADIQRAPVLQDDVTATEFLDTELPTLDEYDKVIRNFYTPIRPVPPPKYSLTDAMLAAIPSYDFSQFLRKEREKIQAVIFLERRASQSKIKPLSDSQLAIVESKWKARNTNERIVSDFSIDITVKDIQTLKDSSWLNDNVIDFYLNLVAARSTGIFCWTTHFFSTLKSKGYQGVARWAKRKKVNLLEKDLVIVPINIMSTHWALAVIDNQAKLISYYDSLASRGNLKALQLLSEYMFKESERLLMPQIAYTLHANVKTPQQQNGFDCGVFTCTVAKCLSEQLPLSFSQKDMRLIRRRMAYEIINNNLLSGALQGPHL